MKFIKIGSHKESFFANPPANFPQMLEAHDSWLKEEKKAGRLLEAYFLPGSGRNLSIWDFASPEAIDKNLFEDPMGSTFEWEIFPAADVFEHITHVMSMFK